MLLTGILIFVFLTGCQQNGNNEEPPTEQEKVYEKYSNA